MTRKYRFGYDWIVINICLFEDEVYKDLFPITFMRPAYDLLVGINTIFEKIYDHFSYTNVSLHCRPELKALVKSNHPKLPVNQINISANCLFLNGRVILTDPLIKEFSQLEEDRNYLFTCEGQLVAALANGQILEKLAKLFQGVPDHKKIIHYLRPLCVAKELKDTRIINNLADLVSLNPEILKADCAKKYKGGIIKGEVSPFSAIYNENDVFIDKGSSIEDFVLLNAKNGPIYIEKNVYIESGSRLEGPLFIGQNTKILGGKIKSSSIGAHCKIAGEVSDSVFYRYSNKAHAGFVGHSYIGEWVNLGAQTTTSNLKNNYGSVKINLGAGAIDTGSIFLGSIIGDHAKTGISTSLNTGTVVGFGANVFGPHLHPKYVAPFSWGTANLYETYQLDKFLETAEKMMGRRNVEISKIYKETITYLFSTHVPNPVNT
ncbi:putative sugar nucleotidyl transferase [Candidatus Margulisiibacteriota bacterium]